MLSNASAHARGFSLPIVMAAVALLGLLTMAAFHLVVDQRHRTSLAVDHALAKHGAETALAAAECELSVATRTPTRPDCSVALPQDRIVALNQVALHGFVTGVCGNRVTVGLCQPQPGQSLWELGGFLEEATLGVEIGKPLLTPESKRVSARTARYVIEPIPDQWPGHVVQGGESQQPRLFRITAAGFGTDPAVKVVLQTVFRPRVSDQSTPHVSIQTSPPITHDGTITQTVQTTFWPSNSDPQRAVAAQQKQTIKLGRLSWRELITEGTP